jgi:hypothetical protein
MPNPQHEDAPYPDAGAPTSHQRNQSNPEQAGQPTLHEFLTRLVTSPEARSEFDADPRSALDQAGFHQMTAADVHHAATLALDYAPVEVVTEFDRSLQTSVENFAGVQNVVVEHPHLAAPVIHPQEMHEPEHPVHPPVHPAPPPKDVSDVNMHKADFSKAGDADKHLSGGKGHGDVDIKEQDSHNLINVHDIASGNNIAGGVGNVAQAPGEVVHDVTHTVNNVAETAGHAPTAVTGLAGHLPVVGDVAGHLPVVGGALGHESASHHSTGAEHHDGALSHLPVAGPVADQVGDVAHHLPVAGDVASALPLDHVL